MFDGGESGRSERAHIYQALGAVEKAQVALFTQADERDRAAKERAVEWNRQITELREECRRGRDEAKAEHDALEEKLDKIVKAQSDQAGESKITPLQIIVSTSPITTALLGLIGVVIVKGTP